MNQYGNRRISEKDSLLLSLFRICRSVVLEISSFHEISTYSTVLLISHGLLFAYYCSYYYIIASGRETSQRFETRRVTFVPGSGARAELLK